MRFLFSRKKEIPVPIIIPKNAPKKIISLFCGSRSSEVNLLLPILIDFINLMNKKFDNFNFVFHATDENKNFIMYDNRRTI